MSEIIVQATYALHAYIPLHHAVKAGQPRLCGSVSATKIIENADILHFVFLPDVLLTLLNLPKKRACPCHLKRLIRLHKKAHIRIKTFLVRSCRKNSRHFKIILAPFQKNLYAKSENFWRDLLYVFGSIFSPLLAHCFATQPIAPVHRLSPSFGSCPKQQRGHTGTFIPIWPLYF